MQSGAPETFRCLNSGPHFQPQQHMGVPGLKSMIRKDQITIFVGVAVAEPVEVNILPFLTRTTIGPEHHWPSIRTEHRRNEGSLQALQQYCASRKTDAEARNHHQYLSAFPPLVSPYSPRSTTCALDYSLPPISHPKALG